MLRLDLHIVQRVEMYLMMVGSFSFHDLSSVRRSKKGIPKIVGATQQFVNNANLMAFSLAYKCRCYSWSFFTFRCFVVVVVVVFRSMTSPEMVTSRRHTDPPIRHLLCINQPEALRRIRRHCLTDRRTLLEITQNYSISLFECKMSMKNAYTFTIIISNH